jgi:hypothetical protein
MDSPGSRKPPTPPGPTFRDWALFAIGATFVAMSLFIASRDGLREALFPLCFFGVCALVSGYVIVRKLRRRRFTAKFASVPGGVALHASNARMLGVAALIAIAVAPVFFVNDPPLLLTLCAVVALGGSALVLFFVVSGRFSRRFLRFDPPGLTLGDGQHECLYLWDHIVDLDEFEMQDNAAVGFNLVNPDALLVKPETARAQVYKTMGRNAGFTGRHVVIMPMHFGVSAEALCAAIRNYMANPEARRELVAKPAIGGPN